MTYAHYLSCTCFFGSLWLWTNPAEKALTRSGVQKGLCSDFARCTSVPRKKDVCFSWLPPDKGNQFVRDIKSYIENRGFTNLNANFSKSCINSDIVALKMNSYKGHCPLILLIFQFRKMIVLRNWNPFFGLKARFCKLNAKAPEALKLQGLSCF